MSIKIPTEPGRRVDEYNENPSKETEITRQHQTEVTELNNAINELKNTPKVFNNRLYEAEELINKQL